MSFTDTCCALYATLLSSVFGYGLTTFFAYPCMREGRAFWKLMKFFLQKTYLRYSDSCRNVFSIGKVRSYVFSISTIALKNKNSRSITCLNDRYSGFTINLVPELSMSAKEICSSGEQAVCRSSRLSNSADLYQSSRDFQGLRHWMAHLMTLLLAKKMLISEARV